MSLRSAAVIRLPRDADPVSPARRIAAAFEWLPPSEWLVQDKFTRGGYLEDVFEILVGHALEVGFVYTAGNGKAVAVWMPSDVPQVPVEYDERLAKATGDHLPRFKAFDAAIAEWQLRGVPHHHLAFLAVDARERRKGLGRALLAAHHRVLDKLGLDATLDAATAELAHGFYAKAGYDPRGRIIQLPDGPQMFPMQRRPHAAQS